jgi:hypothetical protein
MNGNQVTQTSFIGSSASVTGLTYTINQANGLDVTVGAASAYYTFSSSDTNVATVNQNGQVSVVAEGTAEITATLGGISANGTLTVESVGDFTPAPVPAEAPENVISIFSDTYDNVPVDFYNGFYAPFQTTTSNDFTVNGNNVLGYENFNFVGVEFNQSVPTIDASEMTNLTLDVFFPDEVPSGSALRVVLVDVGSDLAVGGGDDSSVSATLRSPSNPDNPQPDDLVSGQWVSFDFDITGLANRNNLGQIVLDADLGIALRGESFYVDNIYLYNSAAE